MHIQNCTSETILIDTGSDGFITLKPAETPTTVAFEADDPSGEIRHIQFGKEHQVYQLPIRRETPVLENLPAPDSGTLFLVTPNVYPFVPIDRTDVFTFNATARRTLFSVVMEYLIGHPVAQAETPSLDTPPPETPAIPFLASTEALYDYLQAIIPMTAQGRSEYTTLLKDTFTDPEFEQLLSLLETLAERHVIGYRIEKDCVRVVLKVRNG